MTKPRRENLHRGRINSSQKHSGEKTQDDRELDILRKQTKRAIDDGAGDRGQRKEMTRTDDVGKVEKRAQQSASNESKLY